MILSTFFRYLFFTAGIEWRSLPFFGINNEINYVSNIPAEVNKERLILSKHVVNLFLEDILISSGLNSEKIIFILDGDRNGIYNNHKNRRQSFFSEMATYFKNNAIENGFSVVDMQEIFFNDYKNNIKKFEFEVDGHWNEYAHRLVANEILKWHQLKKYDLSVFNEIH